MGAGQSTASKIPPKALHVLRVTPSSPASQTSIEPYFDFLIGFKDENLASNNIDAAELERIVEAHEGRPLDLLVWNSKSQQVRGELQSPTCPLHSLTACSSRPHRTVTTMEPAVRRARPQGARCGGTQALPVRPEYAHVRARVRDGERMACP